MKKEKFNLIKYLKTNILIIIGAIIILLLGTIIGLMLNNNFNSSNVSNNEIQNSYEEEQDDNDEIENNTTNETNNSQETNNTEEDITVSSKDEIINTYFLNYEEEVTSSFSESVSAGLEKSKEFFIVVVDFLFYDSQINGITFDELSDSAKQKVLTIVSRVDVFITNYYPYYKEDVLNLYDGASDVFFELIEKGSTNINDFVTENIPSDTLTSIKSYSTSFYNTIKDTINSIPIEETVTDTLDKLDEWYNDFKS
ncbi:MAG: hypothetical protein R3Y21_00840 [Mycoplasmatota bacterium]